jgi:hypothetical protein
MLANWTKATTTTTGTGTITMTAVTGYPLPSKSRVTGEYVQYSIHTSDGNFESGIGKIAASETLERTRVISTYNGTTYDQLTASALSLASGTHDVFITPMAENIFEPLRFPVSGPSSQAFYSTHLNGPGAYITLTSQRNTAYPFRLETAGLLTSLACNVGVAGAGSTTLLGLYEPGSNGLPNRLIAKTSATIDTSTTGFKTQAVGANVRLTPGWYWAAVCLTAGTAPQLDSTSTGVASAFGNSGNSIITYVRENATATDLADPYPITATQYSHSSSASHLRVGLILS